MRVVNQGRCALPPYQQCTSCYVPSNCDYKNRLLQHESPHSEPNSERGENPVSLMAWTRTGVGSGRGP